MKNSLSNWSWDEITRAYWAFGSLLEEYAGYKKRCNIPEQIRIMYSDDENIFIMQFNKDIKRIDANLAELDKEIARRNKLIGVVG